MNQFSSGRILAFAFTALFVLSACAESNRPVPYSEVEIADPPGGTREFRHRITSTLTIPRLSLRTTRKFHRATP